MPVLIASSRLSSEVVLNSITRAMDINSPPSLKPSLRKLE
jgi:hypothetical protein